MRLTEAPAAPEPVPVLLQKLIPKRHRLDAETLFAFRCFAGKKGARPAGFEPATRGLEVRNDTFVTAHQGSPMLTNKPNSGYDLAPMFTGVRLGCRQNCRQY